MEGVMISFSLEEVFFFLFSLSFSDSHKHIKSGLYEITLLMAELPHHSFVQKRKSFSLGMNSSFVPDCLR